ncbi:MAG: phosphopantetheine-binding protein [Pseudomonadota bacterium]
MDAEAHPSTLDTLRTLIASELALPVDAQGISSSTKLFDGGLGLDSFAVVELITLIEERFAFQFAEADLRPERFEDLGTLASLVDERTQHIS